MLSCCATWFAYGGGGRPLLQGVSLNLSPGELCVLLGRNGSGKSTLCRLLCGLYLPFDGYVSVDGVRTDRRSPRATPPLPRPVQFVAHDPAVQVIGETVIEDVVLAFHAGPEVETLALKMLYALGIGQLAGRRTDGLSGGELQLVRLAGALVARPRYLILDEALAMVDGTLRHRAFETLRTLREETGLAVLLATHELEDLAWADRVAWLDAGKIMLDAPVETALEALAAHTHPPFALPDVLEVALRLRAADASMPLTVGVEALVGAICASRS